MDIFDTQFVNGKRKRIHALRCHLPMCCQYSICIILFACHISVELFECLLSVNVIVNCVYTALLND